MLVEKQKVKMVEKLQRFAKTLESMIFVKVADLEMEMFHTTESLYAIPNDDKFQPCTKGDTWEGEKTYCWFKGEFIVPEELANKDLYLYPNIGGYEAMLWVNHKPSGIFASKINLNSHGNHYCDLIKKSATQGEHLSIALEYYAHHDFPGVAPLAVESQGDFVYEYQGVNVCIKDDFISEFYFDLQTVLQLYEAENEESFIRANIINKLFKVHKILYYDVDNVDSNKFRLSLEQASLIIKEILMNGNSSSAPEAGIMGHSHMDTAWLWHKGETIKKCARTYANQISLMDQYDEYMFLQSSAYHSELVRRHYPELFERMAEKIKEGRYEPNGGVWIECDCNLPSGEYLIRQFLWGQRYTKKHFNYISDTFWLPDTFGYSASLPQIMKQCGIKYFLTTKMDWNDTNTFPYDTFNWSGLDGTEVLVHFNRTHVWPDAKDLKKYVASSSDGLKEKSVTNKRFIAYGYGDGGGGPQFEMIEMARRVRNLEGVPLAKHQSVSQFMASLEKEVVHPSTYSGELYLELHRGTLTSKHQIKRNNRLAEIALHDLEYLTVRKAIEHNEVATGEKIAPLMEELLVNQFHDILPGTCIQQAHEESISETTKIIEESNSLIEHLVRDENSENQITLYNTLSFDRDEVVYIPYEPNKRIKGDYPQQIVELISGEKVISVGGITIPAFSSVTLTLEEGSIRDLRNNGFQFSCQSLETPFYLVEFDARNYIKSLIDKNADHREICGKGYPLNTFLVAEDVPSYWDNWDVDADLEYKFKDTALICSSEIVSSGDVEFRLRTVYQITEKSTITQDMIFYHQSKEIRFDTLLDWNDDHRFLKTAFDTSIFTRHAKQEIQFGYIERPTTRNNSEEKAKFEVVNHKYSDLSELGYGVALLNDCKYGISIEKSSLYLSLHKGGNRPDSSGDHGLHQCSYALLPHEGNFSAKKVVQPAYQFNFKPIQVQNGKDVSSLLSLDKDNVIVETVKPLEDADTGFILRLYETEGSLTSVNLKLNVDTKKLEFVDMLENTIDELDTTQLVFKPFEIKNIKVYY